MSVNNLNNQNLQAIYDNLTQLSKELSGTQNEAGETLFDQKEKTVEDGFVSTTSSAPQDTAENASSVSVLTGLVNVLSNLVGSLMGANNANSTAEVSQADTEPAVSASALTFDISVNQTQSVSGTDAVTRTAKAEKPEIKSMAEYTEILDNKFDELYDRFGGKTSEITQYVKNNYGEFMDITGDGRVDALDLMIWANYQKSCSNSSAAKKDFSNEVLKGVRQLMCSQNLNNTIQYDFEDIENAMKLYNSANISNYSVGTGIKIPQYLLNHLDVTKVAQDENWETKFDTYATPANTYRDLKNQISKTAEFAKNNPEKANYAGLATYYELYMKEEERLENSGAKARQNSAAQNKYLEYARRLAADINGDGVVDVNDIAMMSCSVDLDGDGKVSSCELAFLQSVKSGLNDRVYNIAAVQGHYNANSIEDVINILEAYDSSYLQEKKKAAVSANEAMYADSYYDSRHDAGYVTVNGVQYKASHETSGRTGRYALGILNKNVPGRSGILGDFMDGTKGVMSTSDGNSRNDLLNIDDLSYTNQRVVDAIESATPQNTYLHYIQSADLTQEELQEILNKINSASASVQNQLAQIKAVVVAKLTNM